jgi:predicted nucleic acid-binding protein
LRKLRVYLDNCCYCRPYDDQTQILIEVEASAVSYIQHLVAIGQIELVWSHILSYENSFHPIPEEAKNIRKWRGLSTVNAGITQNIIRLSKDIQAAGLKKFDSLHIACAIDAKCDFMITVDKKMLKYLNGSIKICDPVEFLRNLGVISI